MTDFSRFIVCAVCHVDLSPATTGSDEARRCPQCGRGYSARNGVYNMIPLPLPDEVLRSKWETWQQLQSNGEISYSSAPEFNLSIGDRRDAQAFRSFCEASGLVLDVGCGPQAFPSYLPEACRVVGIDPLIGIQPRGFDFVQGIGEYLPFRDDTFDNVIYASSLDHIIDPRRSLAEAVRCAKPGGCISLWVDGLASSDSSSAPAGWRRYPALARKGLKSLSRHSWLREMGLRRTLSYVGSVATMKVPEGASDCFHFVSLNISSVLAWLEDLDLTITRQEEYAEADSIFIQAQTPRRKS